jgi:hypothetical protein
MTSNKTTIFPIFLFDHLCRHSNAVFFFSQLGMMDSRPVSDLLPSDSAALSSPPLRPAGSGGGAEPRPFLKRGSGLSRFNLPPDPALQPSRLKRRSRSSPKLADSPDLRNPARLRLVTTGIADSYDWPGIWAGFFFACTSSSGLKSRLL